MRDSLFKKAQKIISEKRIKKTTTTDKAEFFSIVPSRYKPDEELLPEEYYQVAVFYDNYTLKHTCTCKNMSASQPTNLCAHKIAAITKLTIESK